MTERTLTLLRADPRSHGKLAKAAGVGRDWVAKLRQGRIKNPGAERLERLYHVLSRLDGE